MKNAESETTGCGRARPARLTGIAVPLGAVYTKKEMAVGEFTVLPELAKFCKKAGLGIIQLLPVNDTGTQSSPYSGLSAFALHPLYIDISALPEFSALYESDAKFAKKYDAMLKKFPYDGATRYDYQGILDAKTELLEALYASTDIAASGAASDELEKWIKKNPWIASYAVYKNLKKKYRQSTWKDWKKEDQTPGAAEIKRRWNSAPAKKEHLFYAWTQMRAAQQFRAASAAVRKAGIILKGDMPILMNEDSCDAWALPEIFNHDLRAGSPVDGENPAGQNWGFPTYNWEYLKEHQFGWWVDRLKSAEQYYGAYRLDHILGFFRIWAIPARDTTAVLGHTVPYVPVSRQELYNAGFDDGRIRWLSQPHVPTGLVEDITWNHDAACAILGQFMNRIGGEELWLFKPELKGDKDICEADLGAWCGEDAARRIKDALSRCWRDRCLIALSEDSFVPVWTYYESSAWKSLSDDERGRLKGLIDHAEWEQSRLWERQSDEILSTLTSSVGMVPCGEDLGADLPCLPSVMDRNGILALRVIRWCRRWKEQPVQPYIPLGELAPLSVATSAVHDSPTLRQWWQEDRNGAALFVRTHPECFGVDPGDWNAVEAAAAAPFSPAAAEGFLSTVARAASVWCIHPAQDFLSLEERYWLSNPQDERVNIPGSVSEFNWTYRLPALLAEINKDENLIAKIKRIAALHNGGNQ
ncbi:MAG: 4-alpha-glucanotransferase [Treponemataceae bacterium]|nr:4-alpha-glucanotransferase [Treponemataceae bacterium]